MAGNPNSGKSSLFNALTGLNQKIANFPGVTVEKKSAKILLPGGQTCQIIDFPGAYSLHAITLDEQVFTKLIRDRNNENFPDLICYVVNSEHIERQLLLASQIRDLGIPMIIALSMSDIEPLSEDKTEAIKNYFNVPVVRCSSRTGEGISELKTAIQQGLAHQNIPIQALENPANYSEKLRESGLTDQNTAVNNYSEFLSILDSKAKEKHKSVLQAEVWDTMSRYEALSPLINRLKPDKEPIPPVQNKVDRILVHPVWGMLIFAAIMFLVFQSIFSWSEKPIEILENAFSSSADLIGRYLPESWVTDLVINGIIPGISGIIVFVPQIVFLFLFISILEESGYMSRVVYLFDYRMRKFGLNGRSTIALISGGACAIPAIMSTRTISNWKERLITIMVTPMISCSARLPVYSLLIVFIVPATRLFGFINARGLAFLGIYVFSTLAALFAAFVFKKIIKTNEKSQLMLELPNYRMPIIKNVLYNVWEKVKTFVTEAGKVIFVISIILWFLTSYGPEKRREAALEAYHTELKADPAVAEQHSESSVLLENSYAGIAGQYIEPLIKPLGFDWKIGIALITSFAAREVFVGTMATIYSARDDGEDTDRLSELLEKQKDPDTGRKVFNPATSASLIMFYIFALQCLSTVAVVKKETNGWKWPLIQLITYTLLAYFASLVTYQVLIS